MRGLGLTEAMDRLMRGYTSGVQAGTQGVGQMVGLIAQQKADQRKMEADAKKMQDEAKARQLELSEKRDFDIAQQRREQDLEAAKAGLRRRTVVDNQEEVDKARWDAGNRVQANPAARLADSGAMGIPGVPAGALTAMELGKTMRDPRNQEHRVDAGWERDPDFVDPNAKPKPTGLDPSRQQWFATEARQRVLKSPQLDVMTRLLMAMDTTDDLAEKASIAQQLKQFDEKTLAKMRSDYTAAIANEQISLMEQAVRQGVEDAPFLERAVRGMRGGPGAAAGAPAGAPEEDHGAQMSIGQPAMSVDDAMDVDLDDPNISPEVKQAALEAAELDQAAAPQSMAGPPVPPATPRPSEPGLVNPFPPSEFAEDFDAVRSGRATPPAPSPPQEMPMPSQPMPPMDLGEMTEDLDGMRGSRVGAPMAPPASARFPFSPQDIASTIEKMRSAGRLAGQPPPPTPVSTLGQAPAPPRPPSMPPELSNVAQSLLSVQRRPMPPAPPPPARPDPLAGSAVWSGPRQPPRPMPPAPPPQGGGGVGVMDVLKLLATGGVGSGGAAAMPAGPNGMADVSVPGAGGSVQLHPAAAQALRDALNDPAMGMADLESAHGIAGGYRSQERQDELRSLWVENFGADRDFNDLTDEEKAMAKSLGLHGRPGVTSYHTSGLGLDANGLSPAMLKALLDRGFREEPGVGHDGHYIFGPG